MKTIKNQVVAIIPARSGSKGVLDKNIKLLAEHPLMAWSIRVAQKSMLIDRVLVSTDSKKYAQIAKEYGAEVPFLRPEQFATDTSQDIDFVLHALEWLLSNEQKIPEYLVHLRPTMPFRDPSVIDQAIEKIISDKYATSLCSAHEVAPICKHFKLNRDNTFSAYHGEEFISMPRQHCEKAFLSNGYVDVLVPEHILKNHNLYGNKRLAFITLPNEDIDDNNDFIAVQNSYKISYFLNKLFN